MTNTALRRGMALPVLCLCIAGCGRKAAPAGSADPGAPAVVRLPPPILPSDTAKPDTMQNHFEKMEAAQTGLATSNAILGAAIVFGDRRMIATMYMQDATLVTPDSTYQGVVAITNALAALGPPNSLRDFRRKSRGFRIVDSTLVDSGTYVATAKREGADSIAERGSYRSTWQMKRPPQPWVLKSDELHSTSRTRRKG